MRLGQRKRADLVCRILRCDHEERFVERIGLAVRGDLVLLHGFEQRALRLGRRPIDFVGQHQLREHWSAVEPELSGLRLEDRDADDIGRQQVARELDALVAEAERRGERVRKRRLADAGNILDQQVTAGEQAGQAKANLLLLAEDDLVEPGNRACDQVRCARLDAGQCWRCDDHWFVLLHGCDGCESS